MKCPKCGFEQEGTLECALCGVIFARYREAAPPQPTGITSNPGAPQRSFIRRAFRVLRWLSLAGAVIVILMILHSSPPPPVTISPEAAVKAEQKVEAFQSSAMRGHSEILEMDESELNGWLSNNLALNRGGSPAQASLSTPESTIDQASQDAELLAQSSLHDFKVALSEDTMRAYAIVDVLGKEVSLEIEGRLLNQDGYIRIEPLSGKLGSLPLSETMLVNLLDRVFNSPENREKFKLPPHIRDIAIEDSRLVVTGRPNW